MKLTEVQKFRKDIAPVAYTVLKGRLLAIDPGSNVLGWALFDKGELVESGSIAAHPKNKPHKRIISIMHDLKDATAKACDVLCVEQMFKFNPSLIWSVGAVIEAKQPELFVEIPTRIWQAKLPADYVKSDERDAIEIGKALIYHSSRL